MVDVTNSPFKPRGQLVWFSKWQKKNKIQMQCPFVHAALTERAQFWRQRGIWVYVVTTTPGPGKLKPQWGRRKVASTFKISGTASFPGVWELGRTLLCGGEGATLTEQGCQQNMGGSAWRMKKWSCFHSWSSSEKTLKNVRVSAGVLQLSDKGNRNARVTPFYVFITFSFMPCFFFPIFFNALLLKRILL